MATAIIVGTTAVAGTSCPSRTDASRPSFSPAIAQDPAASPTPGLFSIRTTRLEGCPHDSTQGSSAVGRAFRYAHLRPQHPDTGLRSKYGRPHDRTGLLTSDILGDSVARWHRWRLSSETSSGFVEVIIVPTAHSPGTAHESWLSRSEWRHFQSDILLAVRWYLRYPLSYHPTCQNDDVGRGN